MDFVVKSRSKATKKFIELLMPSLIEQLKLKNSRKFVFVEVAKDGPGAGNEGVTMAMDALDSYVVSLCPAPPERLGATLAHEMVHVKQMAKGQLKSKGKSNYWNSKRFTKKTKYLDSPWEVEAFTKQELLFRRALIKIIGN